MTLSGLLQRGKGPKAPNWWVQMQKMPKMSEVWSMVPTTERSPKQKLGRHEGARRLWLVSLRQQPQQSTNKVSKNPPEKLARCVLTVRNQCHKTNQSTKVCWIVFYVFRKTTYAPLGQSYSEDHCWCCAAPQMKTPSCCRFISWARMQNCKTKIRT